MRGTTPRLISSDAFAGYATVLDVLWPQRPRPVPGGQGRKPPVDKRPRARLNYATVCKRRRNGRVVAVDVKTVYGGRRSLAQALKQSSVSAAVNTSFLERHNGTDRHRNARKSRRTYRFSKDWKIHQQVSDFCHYTYNFCWCVRTLRKKSKNGTCQKRTPAMSAGLTDHVWSLREWLSYPVKQLST